MEEKVHVGRPTNEEIKERNGKKIRKIILSIIIGIILLFVVISVGSVIYTNSVTVKLNETATIEKDKIKITVLGSEKVNINKELSIANGDYTKVKIAIENYGTDTYSWSYNFSLGDEMVALNTLSEEDNLQADIAPGETATGYLYFPVTDETILEYVSHTQVNDDASASASKTYFKIK